MRFTEFKITETFNIEVPSSGGLASVRTGLAVANLQKALDALGYNIGQTGVDGIYGPRTRAAVRQFQSDDGTIRVDGDAGPETIPKIMQRLRDENITLTPATAADVQTTQAAAPSGYADSELTTGESEGRVEQIQRETAGIRRLPISRALMNVLQAAAEEVRVDVVVTSGGQMPYAEWERSPGRGRHRNSSNQWVYTINGRAVRIGSRRHDGGNAADLQIKSGGRFVRLDTPLMNSFITACFRHGAEGGGGSPGYMGDTTVHIDVIGTSLGGGQTWRSTNQFVAAVRRGLQQRGTA